MIKPKTRLLSRIFLTVFTKLSVSINKVQKMGGKQYVATSKPEYGMTLVIFENANGQKVSLPKSDIEKVVEQKK